MSDPPYPTVEDLLAQVTYIRRELNTRPRWGPVDFRDFYDRDVSSFLLPLAENMLDAVGPGRSAYRDVVTERVAQDREHGGPGHDDTHTAKDWLGFISRKTALADKEEQEERYRQRLVQIAALAVAAIQSHDRKTATKS